MAHTHIEAALASAYSVFLVFISRALEWLAERTHRRADAFRRRGFQYHGHLDVWECPAGEHLHLREVDRPRRLARYRARPEVCNACALKAQCTDSDSGRELVQSTHDWLDTEIGRFHRGLSLTLLLLSALILGIAWARHHSRPDTVVLALAAAAVAARASTLRRRGAAQVEPYHGRVWGAWRSPLRPADASDGISHCTAIATRLAPYATTASRRARRWDDPRRGSETTNHD